MEILLVVDLSNNLSKTLGRRGAIVGLQRADAETLAQKKFLAESSCESLTHERADKQTSTYRTSAAAVSSLNRTQQSIVED